jgi:hypothetical protein
MTFIYAFMNGIISPKSDYLKSCVNGTACHLAACLDLAAVESMTFAITIT